MYKDATIFENCGNTLLSEWYDKQRGRLYSINAKSLLTLDTLAEGITVKKSTILYLDSGLRLFAPQKIYKREAVG